MSLMRTSVILHLSTRVSNGCQACHYCCYYCCMYHSTYVGLRRLCFVSSGCREVGRLPRPGQMTKLGHGELEGLVDWYVLKG